MEEKEQRGGKAAGDISALLLTSSKLYSANNQAKESHQHHFNGIQ